MEGGACGSHSSRPGRLGMGGAAPEGFCRAGWHRGPRLPHVLSLAGKKGPPRHAGHKTEPSFPDHCLLLAEGGSLLGTKVT